MEIIDADGHVNDGAGQDEIARYMPAGNRLSQVFPVLDHLHFHYLRPGANRAGLENPGPQEWVSFLDDTGISCSVLYPTFGLAVGRFVSEHWAIAACRAYNNWLHEKFTSKNSRLKGMALLPIQDVEAAVLELRRAVKELGMLGGMLPSNGQGIKNHLGANVYWPLYAEAEKLGSSLAVHVGSLHHLGMDGFSTYYPVHALGHPFGIAIQAAGMLAHGIFERFPKLRVAFLEGGSTWVPFFLDRLDRSYHRGHLQVDLDVKAKRKRKDPEIVMRGGKRAAIILDIDEYRELLERVEDADDLKMLKQMRKRPLKFRKLEDVLKHFPRV